MDQTKITYGKRQDQHVAADAEREKRAQELACIEQVMALVEKHG